MRRRELLGQLRRIEGDAITGAQATQQPEQVSARQRSVQDFPLPRSIVFLARTGVSPISRYRYLVFCVS